MADEVLKGFLVSLGFKVDEQGQKKFKEVIQGAVLQANLLASAVEAAATAVAKGLFGMSDSFDKLYFASRRTGASVQNIRALSYAFTQVGGSSGEASAAVENFARAMRTNPGVGGFVRSLGVATQAGGKARDTIDVLMDSIDAIRKRNPHYVGAQLAGILGIDEHQFLLLEKSRDEIRKYRAEYDKTARMMGLNNDQAAESHNKMATALRSLSMIVTVAADRLLTMLAPAMDRVVKAITNWVQSNPEKIEMIFNGIAKAVEWLGQKLIWLAEKAVEMAEDGRWLKMWDRTVKAVEAVASAIKSIVHWLGVLNGMTPGKIMSQMLGISSAQAGELGAPGVTRANAEGGEQPGIIRRGVNAVKRALGIGGAGGIPQGDGGGSTGAGAANPAAAKALADAIARTESGKDGYDTVLGNGRYGRPDKPISKMTLAEAREFGRRVRAAHGSSSALGRYQIVNTTRDAAQKALGIPDTALYDAETQDRMMRWIARNQGLGAWEGLKGNPRAMEEARRALAEGGAKDGPPVSKGAKPTSGWHGNDRFFDGANWYVRGSDGHMTREKPGVTPLNLPKAPPKVFSPGQGGFDVNKLTAPAVPMGGATSVDNSTSRSIIQNNNTTVKIDAGGDPVSAGRHTERAVGRASALNLRNMQTAIA